jgi:hypothetical protein
VLSPDSKPARLQNCEKEIYVVYLKKKKKTKHMKKLGANTQTYNPIMWEIEIRRITVQDQPWQKVLETSSQPKKSQAKWCMPITQEA